MMGLMRGSAAAILAVLTMAPANVEAQTRSSDGARAAVRAQARAAASAPRRPQPQQQSFFSFFADDDDEDERPAARRRASQPQRTQPAAKAQKGPAVLDGGGRPGISPAAPPVVAFNGAQPAGSIVIDSSARALYYVLPGNRAYRYGVAVGREGFGWTGTQRVSRVASWPDWRPPAEMRERVPSLPELMTGGVRNPLGAKAIYLGSTLYRIHGTNDARSIGTASSSGCFRMTNASVLHLAQFVKVGTRVQVLQGLPRNIAGPGGAAGNRT